MTAVPRTARFWHHIDALVAHGESLVRAFHRVLGASSLRIKPLTSSVIAAMRRGMDAVMPPSANGSCVRSVGCLGPRAPARRSCLSPRALPHWVSSLSSSNSASGASWPEKRPMWRLQLPIKCNPATRSFLHPEVPQTWNLWARWAAWEPSHSPTTPKRSGKPLARRYRCRAHARSADGTWVQERSLCRNDNALLAIARGISATLSRRDSERPGSPCTHSAARQGRQASRSPQSIAQSRLAALPPASSPRDFTQSIRWSCIASFRRLAPSRQLRAGTSIRSSPSRLGRRLNEWKREPTDIAGWVRTISSVPLERTTPQEKGVRGSRTRVAQACRRRRADGARQAQSIAVPHRPARPALTRHHRLFALPQDLL